MRPFAFLALAAFALLAILSAPAYAESKFVVVTGQEWPTGLSGGEVRCVGGELTGDFPQLCTEGTRHIFLRRVAQTTVIVGSGDDSELMTGTNDVIVNCNFDAEYTGNCWGTFTVTLDGEVGVWEGSWNGQLNLLTGVSSYGAVGYGTAGDVAGMHSKYEAANSGEGYAAFTARINMK